VNSSCSNFSVSLVLSGQNIFPAEVKILKVSKSCLEKRLVIGKISFTVAVGQLLLPHHCSGLATLPSVGAVP